MKLFSELRGVKFLNIIDKSNIEELIFVYSLFIIIFRDVNLLVSLMERRFTREEVTD
jgi:hypothetical protein